MTPHKPKPKPKPKPKQKFVSRPVKRRGGRPSRDEAGQLRGRILDAATGLLLNHGYGATSIEEISRHARVSKRTFYHRFADKAELMGAVVVRLIDGLRPPAHVPLVEGPDLEEILGRLGAMILHAALQPQVLQLHRLIVAESARFPDLAAAVAKAGGRQEAVTLLSGVLLRHGTDIAPGPVAAEFAAQQFLQMIVSLPQLRAIGLGAPMTPAELDDWVRSTVALFLHGVRPPVRA